MSNSYTGSFSLNSLGLGQMGQMAAYQSGMTAQSDATGCKPFAYNPDSGKVRRPRQGDPAVDSFQRYLEASMANNPPSYPLSNPFNHAAHYRNIVYTAVSSMMRVLSSASIRLEIKRDGSGGMANVAGDSRDHDYVAFSDHYLSDFLRSPNPADDFASFLGKCILQYHLTGRLLVWGVPNKWGLPVRFYVLPTALCIPNPGVPTDRYPMGAWRVQNYYPSSGMVGILPGPAAGIASTPGALIDAREIYVMNNPHPLFNWASLSGLDAMGVQTDVVEMMDKAFWSVYRQGPRIAGILTAPGATADQIDDLNSAINSTYAGPDNAGKIWTTGGRVDAPSFTPISLGPEQLDITARATYEAQIIAAVTGQDRTVLGLKTDGVGSYSERWAAMADVRERTYIPWLGMLASMLTRGPVRDWGLEDKGVRVAIRLPRLNDPVMVQADTNAGAADGTMTTDEVRARRDMGPDPLGLGHLPPAIRTMTLQLAAEQGGLPPNPAMPGDDGSEEVVDIADPSDDGTALGALRAGKEEPEGEPIAPTAQVNAMRQQQTKPAKGNKTPKKPAPKAKPNGGGKGPPEKKAIAAYEEPGDSNDPLYSNLLARLEDLEIKSDIAQSAFTYDLGGTLVPAAGAATVPARKKRRVLGSRESHTVIERAVAEVLGVSAVVEVKAELADPDPTPAFDRYAAHRKHLAELPVVASNPLGNPVDHSNVSHVLTLQHPRRIIKAVFKPSDGEQPGLRMHIPMHAGAQAARESAASHVAEIAGYHDLVPATTLRHHDGQHGSVQRFIADGVSAFKFDNDARYGSNHSDVRRAAAFDYLIGNTDRHMGNWLVRPTKHGDKLALIDHGLAFPDRHPDGRESYNYELIRHAMYHKPTRGEPAPNPGGHDPDGKWLAIRRALTDHGIGHKAIADTGKRWRVLTSGRFHFGDLLSEHPDYLIQKLNAAHAATTPTRSGV